ncbi:MAG: hypothetical protein ACHREM_12405 [Polyangiales bacterium]
MRSLAGMTWSARARVRPFPRLFVEARAIDATQSLYRVTARGPSNVRWKLDRREAGTVGNDSHDSTVA